MLTIQEIQIVADPADVAWLNSARRIAATIKRDLTSAGIALTCDIASSARPGRQICFVGHSSDPSFVANISADTRNCWVLVTGGAAVHGLSAQSKHIITLPAFTPACESHFSAWLATWARYSFGSEDLSRTSAALNTGRMDELALAADSLTAALAPVYMVCSLFHDANRGLEDGSLQGDARGLAAQTEVALEDCAKGRRQQVVSSLQPLLDRAKTMTAADPVVALRYLGDHTTGGLWKDIAALRRNKSANLRRKLVAIHAALSSTLHILKAISDGDESVRSAFWTPEEYVLTIAARMRTVTRWHRTHPNSDPGAEVHDAVAFLTAESATQRIRIALKDLRVDAFGAWRKLSVERGAAHLGEDLDTISRVSSVIPLVSEAVEMNPDIVELTDRWQVVVADIIGLTHVWRTKSFADLLSRFAHDWLSNQVIPFLIIARHLAAGDAAFTTQPDLQNVIQSVGSLAGPAEELEARLAGQCGLVMTERFKELSAAAIAAARILERWRRQIIDDAIGNFSYMSGAATQGEALQRLRDELRENPGGLIEDFNAGLLDSSVLRTAEYIYASYVQHAF